MTCAEENIDFANRYLWENSEILISNTSNISQTELPVSVEPTVEYPKNSYQELFMSRTSNMKCYYDIGYYNFK